MNLFWCIPLLISESKMKLIFALLALTTLVYCATLTHEEQLVIQAMTSWIQYKIIYFRVENEVHLCSACPDTPGVLCYSHP